MLWYTLPWKSREKPSPLKKHSDGPGAGNLEAMLSGFIGGVLASSHGIVSAY